MADPRREADMWQKRADTLGSLCDPDCEGRCRECPAVFVSQLLASRSALADQLAAAKKEIEVDNTLIADRAELLEAIPECPEHGACVPYALKWIAGAQVELAALADELQAIDRIVGPQGLPDLPLVERAVLMRKQMDEDEARVKGWQVEVEEARSRCVALADQLAAMTRERDELKIENQRLRITLGGREGYRA